MRRLFSGVKKFVFDSDLRFLWLSGKGFFDNWEDKKYLERKYKAILGKNLNLDNPKTMNEKLQWLKLYDRKPEYTQLVDKYLVRNYIAEKLGEKYLIPLLGVWNNSDEIDFSLLPSKFVLKCNHNSGLGMCICKDKSTLNIKKVRDDLTQGLEQNYYLTGREWPYKNVERKIIAEKYMTDSEKVDCFTDYKFYCFDGYVDCVLVCIERMTGNPKFYFFDKEWNLKRYNIRGKKAPKDFTLPKPREMKKMFDIASFLSKGLPFARIDLYNSNGKIYFGEITLYPDSGFDANRLPEIDEYFGSLIKLPAKKEDA